MTLYITQIKNSVNDDPVSKHFLLFHNDAHNHKITVILKQLKFRRSLRHVSVHAETIIREPFLCLAKCLPDDGSYVNRNISKRP
jgi:hypothetical protein